jgi:hypothetical protein
MPGSPFNRNRGRKSLIISSLKIAILIVAFLSVEMRAITVTDALANIQNTVACLTCDFIAGLIRNQLTG